MTQSMRSHMSMHFANCFAPRQGRPFRHTAHIRPLKSLAVLCAVLLSACGGGGEDTPAVATYRIGGQLTGLGTGKSVVIAEAAGTSTTLNANGAYSLQLAVSATYHLRVQTQPTGQTCTLVNASGTANSDINNIAATCADNTLLGGSVTGLGAGKNLVLQLQAAGGLQQASVSANGRFQFSQPIAGPFVITVQNQPQGQLCTVENGQGTADANTHLPAIAVHCGAETPSVPPAAPARPTLAYGTKSVRVGWAAVHPPAGSSAITYRVIEDADGPGPGTGVAIASGLTTISYDYAVAALLHTRLNATYSVQACNGATCSPLSEARSVDVNQAIGYFKASNTRPGGEFGASVALSDDGRTLAVGARAEAGGSKGINGDPTNMTAPESGSVYVFTRNGTMWVQQAYVKSSNTQEAQSFGFSLALSGDGNLLAVGAPGESGDPGGAVYLFERQGTTWSEQTRMKSDVETLSGGQRFGVNVALSSDGKTLAAAADNEDRYSNDLNGSGAVYVFNRNGPNWIGQTRLTADQRTFANFFGRSMALSGDGSTLAVGALSEDVVYVFGRSGDSWNKQTRVQPAGDKHPSFGRSVALSFDGSTLAAGAPVGGWSGRGGSAFVFIRNGTTWSQQFQAVPALERANYLLGTSVSLSRDGNRLAVGAVEEASNATGINGNESDVSTINAGAVYLFSRNDNVWTRQAYVKPSNTRRNFSFGSSIVLSGDGSTLAVGAPGESSHATGIGGNQTDSSAGVAGAVYMY